MLNRFAKITEINPEINISWEESLFLTFDVDWACDEVLANTIELVQQKDICDTWFITHDTPLLNELRKNPKFELGIHPNFNFLLNGDPRNGATAEEVVDRLLTIVPEAKTIRSHSMTQSSNLLQLFVKKGLTHDCNHFIPEQAQISLKPWHVWNGLIKVSYFWEDDVACIYDTNTPIQLLTQRDGLKVFDFHPIHVFLNTENLERYERTRTIHNNHKELIKHRYQGKGTMTSLEMLLMLV